MFEWITGVIRSLGYLGVALLAFAENVFPPIPSEESSRSPASSRLKVTSASWALLPPVRQAR